MLIGDIAQDFLGQVLHGHDAHEAAVLIDHARHLLVAIAQLFHHIRQRHQLRDHDGLLHDAGGLGGGGQVASQDVDKMHHADWIVLIVDDGVARVVGRHHLADLTEGGVRVNDVHAGARNHGVLHVVLGEVQQAV